MNHGRFTGRFFVPLQRLWKLMRTQYVAVNHTKISNANMILLIQCYMYIETH